MLHKDLTTLDTEERWLSIYTSYQLYIITPYLFKMYFVVVLSFNALTSFYLHLSRHTSVFTEMIGHSIRNRFNIQSYRSMGLFRIHIPNCDTAVLSDRLIQNVFLLFRYQYECVLLYLEHTYSATIKPEIGP